VLRSVPADTTVAGIPAVVIRAAGDSREAAGFPVEVGLRAVVALREAGDEHFKRRPGPHTSVRAAEAKRRAGRRVLATSTQATALPVFIAAVVALALPWLHGIHRDDGVPHSVATDCCFLALLMLFCLPRVRVALMPRRARRAAAYRLAMEQFVGRGLARNNSQSGILIFVSLAEHYARIVAGTAISVRVPQSRWQEAVDALVAHTRNGRIAEGFITAIEMCGEELAKHFPHTTVDRNELPDRIYLI
jgi:putative membrane protein